MPHFDELPVMSADVRRLNGLDVPAQQPAKRTPRRTMAENVALLNEPVDATPQLGTETGMQALWTAALTAHGNDLPVPIPEYHFAAPWRKWRFDHAWPGLLVAVELDGMAWQAGGGHHNTDADREKMNSAAALGWRVLHFTSRALREDSAACIALLRRALER